MRIFDNRRAGSAREPNKRVGLKEGRDGKESGYWSRSPAKAKTIGKILGSSYVCEVLRGTHPRFAGGGRWASISSMDSRPKSTCSQRARPKGRRLKKAAKSCDEIYLAPDPDREGEAIAWHLKGVAGGLGQGQALPPRAVQRDHAPRVKAAFEHPGEIDMHAWTPSRRAVCWTGSWATCDADAVAAASSAA
jgi:DNA topoisomerase IA